MVTWYGGDLVAKACRTYYVKVGREMPRYVVSIVRVGARLAGGFGFPLAPFLLIRVCFKGSYIFYVMVSHLREEPGRLFVRVTGTAIYLQ